MHSKLLAAAGIAALVIFAPVRADASCCDQAKHASHDMKAGMPCCAAETEMKCCAEPDAIAMLLSGQDLLDPQWAPAPPPRQATEIWFQRPVRVGNNILQGRYVIEHDNDRMARGEPCTHIYAYNDRKTPVVTFHCTHLERDRAGKNVAVLYTEGDMQVLQEFQFAGEWAAHGVPAVR